MKKILSLLMVFIFSVLTVFATEQKPENTVIEQTKAVEKDVEIVFVLDLWEGLFRELKLRYGA